MAAEPGGTASASSRAPTTLRSRVFGVEVEADFAAPGLPPAGSETGESLPHTKVEQTSEERVRAAWRPSAPVRLVEERFDDGPPARTIDKDAEGGFLLYARHFGMALISPDGGQVLCAPPEVAEWSWQRFLVGRVLPWAALLRGREVFHASAVRVGSRAVALLAPSGHGKTSLAIRLVLAGAGFMTDDVLAIEPRDGRLIAHPGAGIVAVRPEERRALDPPDWSRLGTVLGEEGKTYVEVEREPEALELGAVYLLDAPGIFEDAGWTGSPADPDAVVHFEAGVAARHLLSSVFIASVTTPERLTRLLDVSATIDAAVPCFRVRFDPTIGSAALGEAILTHASDAVASA